MNLNKYQELAVVTASHLEKTKLQLANFALGVAGEAGEVADLIKKHTGHDHILNAEKVAIELGDTLWYIAALAQLIGYDLETVAQMNITKLAKRYPNGFSSEASINRKE